MKRFVVAISLLGACGPLPQRNATTASAQPVTCQQVTTTGSMMTRTMCRTDEEAEEQRAAARQAVGEPKNGPKPLPEGYQP